MSPVHYGSLQRNRCTLCDDFSARYRTQVYVSRGQVDTKYCLSEVISSREPRFRGLFEGLDNVFR